MANNVDNFICVQGNEAVMAEWETLFVKYGENTERPSYHGDGTINVWEYEEIQKHPFMTGYNPDEGWYDWGCENVGAKWAHIEHAEETFVNITSAWSAITPYVEKLYWHLEKLDAQVQIQHNYEDEFRNFIGVGTWDNECYDEVNLEWDDIEVMMENKFGKEYHKQENWDWHEYHEEAECYPNEYQDDLVITFFNDNGVSWR